MKNVNSGGNSFVSLRYLFFTFLKIGSLSFGGFMALISIIQNQLVEKDKKIENGVVLDGISLASVLPGPVAVNVVTFIGYKLRGLSGALISMTAIIIPSFVLLVLLSYLYFQFGNMPALGKVFNGIIPAVTAIIIVVAVNMSRKTIKDYKQVLIAAASGIFLFFQGGFLSTFIIIIAGALAGILLYKKQLAENNTKADKSDIRPKINTRKILIVLSVVSVATLIWYFLPDSFYNIKLLAVTFSSLSVTLFGGGYVMIPAMHEIIVEHLHWLSAKEFADGIALGQITPGPIYISAAFIGYKIKGLLGAFVATLAMFLPAGIVMIISSGFFMFFDSSVWLKSAFKGLRPAVIGMIFTAAYFIGKTAEPAWPSLLIFILTLILSFRYKLNPVFLIPASGIIGVFVF